MSEILRALRAAVASPDEIYSVVGTVAAIDEAARTCDVEPLDGSAQIFGCRLQAAIDGQNGLVVFPKKGSAVVASFFSKDTAFVALAAEIDRIEAVIEGQTLDFDQKGLRLKSDSSDVRTEADALLDELSKLIDTLLAFQLTTNMGLTIAVAPPVIQKLTQHKTKLAQIKTGFGSFLKS